MKKRTKKNIVIGALVIAGFAPSLAFAGFNDNVPASSSALGDPHAEDTYVASEWLKQHPSSDYISPEDMKNILADGSVPDASIDEDEKGTGEVYLSGKIFANCSGLFEVSNTSDPSNPVAQKLAQEKRHRMPTFNAQVDDKSVDLPTAGFIITDPKGKGRE